MLRFYRTIIYALASMVAVFSLGLCALAAIDQADQLPRADDPSGSVTGVPDYELETLKGTTLRLSSLRGHIVLLDFFSATCPHCQAHAPFVAELAKRYRERGLIVINMCANNPYVDRGEVEKYVRNAGIENDVVWTPSELIRLYLTPLPDGRYGVPQAVLFGYDGRLVARFSAWEEKDKEQIEQTIVKYLTNSK
jgi:thiol-disulfide isomerase/thioredoxin